MLWTWTSASVMSLISWVMAHDRLADRFKLPQLLLLLGGISPDILKLPLKSLILRLDGLAVLLEGGELLVRPLVGCRTAASGRAAL